MKKRNLVVTHGDVDGVISGALVVKKYNLDLTETDVVFIQPFLLDKVDFGEYEKVFVADIAINNRNPKMTRRFIEVLGNQLVIWYDHHRGWQNTDQRFVIDESSPSCAKVIGGPTEWIEAANVIDSRKGFSELGQLLDQAITVDLSDDTVRRVSFEYVLGLNDGELLREKQQEYRKIEKKTEELVESGSLKKNMLVINTRGEKGFDRTQLFMKGYNRAPFVVVLGEFKGEITTTVATKEKVDLLKVFDLKSGAPFRITLEGNRVEFVLKKIFPKA